MQGRQPDPRWKEFIEQTDKDGKITGFKLPDNDYEFKYDEYGGWTDEHGKVYDSEGYLIEFDDNQDDEDDESDDIHDEIIDDFEKMLKQEEQGIISNKKQPDTKTTEAKVTKEAKVLKGGNHVVDEEFRKYIEKLQKGDELRENLTSDVWIFFKMKSSQYEKITPEVEKRQDLNSRNQLIKQIKAKCEERKKELLDKNKWLQGAYTLDFSGTSESEGTYERYWYGWIKVKPESFFSTLEEIKKSNQFSLFKSKTLFALKSKFFLKSKMKETIQKLRDQLKDIPEDQAVLIKINNLPEEFPISLILDLIELSGGYFEDVEDIDIVDEFSADMFVKKRTALAFTNIEGYQHDEHEYIWIEVQPKGRPIRCNDMFNVEIDAQYKNPMRETGDTLALEYSKKQIVKVGEKNDSFRLIVGPDALKKVLMFRGETMNVVRIVRFEKK